MVDISTAIPTIAQIVQSLNSPQLPNFHVGSANGDANVAASAVSDVASSGSVGSSCGSSVDTYA